AFTASDWTMYPFASQNKKDYYNLMDVYLDAAFFPNIDDLSFKQEGHRLELAETDMGVELEYKGVVYNEMKGAMSSPSQVLSRSLLASLYPNTTYSNNSGGEPADIPKLSHEALKAFHARYYHPSNSYFYTYGSFPLEETLAVLSKKVLNKFDYLEIDSAVPSQPRWNSPKEQIQAYAYSDPEDLTNKYQACVAWLTCDIKDSFEILVLTVLEQILLGNSASPMRKALIDSNLGSALSDGTGFDADNRDTMFVCGLKDIAKKSIPQVEEIIFSTLRQISENGIEKQLIDSAIHQIEFYRKEITNTPYPFGIKLLLSFAGTMIHDGDPVSCINIDEDLEKLTQKIGQGGFLEERIIHYFLENPHRVLFTLEPDNQLEENQVKETKEELKAILATLKPDDLAQIKKDSAALESLQESEEDLSTLPTLKLSDVPHKIEIIKPDQLNKINFSTCYDKATSGILYFTCPVGAGNIPADLFPLVPFFSSAFTNSGTKKSSYSEIAENMDLYTGGITISPFSGSYFSKDADSHSFLALQGKALDRNINNMFDMIDEFVKKFGFQDQDRLKSLLLQYQSGLESSIVSAGHRYAISLSARHLSKASHINELWHGIDQFQLIKKITGQLADPETAQTTLDTLSSNLETIASSLFRKDNLKPAIIGNPQALHNADQRIGQLHAQLANGDKNSFYTPDIALDTQRPYDGWYTNTAVSFVGQSFKTVRITHKDSPGLAV
ncbi:MAG: peptidase M16, partial [Desulfobacteraceae bacterium]|nr:peptidase M16 [Desulfobacteraceae bacterium]